MVSTFTTMARLRCALHVYGGVSRFVKCLGVYGFIGFNKISHENIRGKRAARGGAGLNVSVPAIISKRWSRWVDQEKPDKQGWRGGMHRHQYRCLAAGIRQRTTVCERCSVLRTRPNLSYPPPLESIAGAARSVRLPSPAPVRGKIRCGWRAGGVGVPQIYCAPFPCIGQPASCRPSP